MIDIPVENFVFLVCTLVGGGLLIKVTDGGSPNAPAIRPPSADAVDGRGLAIVEALSRRWGVDRDGLGQCVWAELP